MQYVGMLALSLLAVGCSAKVSHTNSNTSTGTPTTGTPSIGGSAGETNSSSGGMGGTEGGSLGGGGSTGGGDSGGGGGESTTGSQGGTGGASGGTGGGDTSSSGGTTSSGGTGGGGTGGGGTGGSGTGGSGGSVSMLPNGADCTGNAECSDGHCVEGICCNEVCEGQCESCSESGSEGTCTVRTGDPLPTRTACAGSGMCGGQCDGDNGAACSYPDSSSVCSEATCSAGEVTTASVCNGAGACTPPGTSTCDNSLCADDGSATCDTSCTASSCGSTAYCDTTGACLPKLSNGTTCSTETHCTSGECVDGVCCNDACDGQCESCAESGAVGTCSARSGVPLAPRGACGGSGDCGSSCNGNNRNACVYPGGSTVCEDPICSGGMYTPAATCDGLGGCQTEASTPCVGNRCVAGECAACIQSSCTGATFCNSSGVCEYKITDGNSCQGNEQCQSNNCSTSGGGSICCGSGLTNCGGSCVNLTNNDQFCGSCTNACGPNRECQSSSCACEGYVLGGSCGGCGSWSFETNSAEGWLIDDFTLFLIDDGSGSAASNAIASQGQVSEGSYSLAVPFLTDASSNKYAAVTVPLCTSSGGTLNIGGYTMSADLYITGDGVFNDYTWVWFGGASTSEFVRLPVLFAAQVMQDQWLHADVTFNDPLAIDHISIELSNDIGNFEGVMYIDNVQLTGP